MSLSCLFNFSKRKFSIKFNKRQEKADKIPANNDIACTLANVSINLPPFCCNE